MEQSPWQDNTLDDFMAVGHYPLLPRQPEGEMGGIWEYALGSTCGAIFKKHFFGSTEENWEELKGPKIYSVKQLTYLFFSGTISPSFK